MTIRVTHTLSYSGFVASWQGGTRHLHPTGLSGYTDSNVPHPSAGRCPMFQKAPAMSRGQRFDFTTDDGWVLSAMVWRPDSQVEHRPEPVVLVHGLGEHCGRYESLAADLNSLGFVVWGLDLRGHGRSPGKRGHAPGWSAWVRDIAAFLQRVREDRQEPAGRSDPADPADPADPTTAGPALPIVAAHSLGGLIALRVAQQWPERIGRLILISPYFRPAFQPQWWRLAVGRLLRRIWPGLTLNVGLRLEQFAHDPQVQAAIRDDPLSHQRLSARMAMEVIEVGQAALVPPWPLAVPCQILHGDQDQVNSFQATKTYVRLQNLWQRGSRPSAENLQNDLADCTAQPEGTAWSDRTDVSESDSLAMAYSLMEFPTTGVFESERHAKAYPLIEFHPIADGAHQLHNDQATRGRVLALFQGNS